MANRILVLAGGGERPLEAFAKAAQKLLLETTVSSFSRLSYFTSEGKLLVNGQDLASFDVVYFRVVGKRLEDATLVVEYLEDKKVKIVDRLPMAKSLEAWLLAKAGIPVPRTYFGGLAMIAREAPRLFGFPFVLKGTAGKQGHEVWSPRNQKELTRLIGSLSELEKEGKRFIAQEFIRASQRLRVLVIGGKVVAGITRPTRWRKRFSKKEPVRGPLNPIAQSAAELAVRAASSLGIEIAGVDIIHDDKTGKPYVLEVNSAPRWVALEKDTGINVEEEILRYLASL